LLADDGGHGISLLDNCGRYSKRESSSSRSGDPAFAFENSF
jgi:hypothetical protein